MQACNILHHVIILYVGMPGLVKALLTSKEIRILCAPLYLTPCTSVVNYGHTFTKPPNAKRFNHRSAGVRAQRRAEA